MGEVQHIFLVGAKSLGAYGGYETFINKLTEYHQSNQNIKYHVACKANGDGCMDEGTLAGVMDKKMVVGKDGKQKCVEFTYHNAHCFKIDIPQKLGSAQAIYYDVAALKKCCEIIKEHQSSNPGEMEHPIVYIMACRIGPFMKHYYQEIHKLGGKVYLNPDGHEWMRAKWSKPVRKYWKESEAMMVKWSDLVICDSVTIEKYIHDCYDRKGIGGKNPKTTFIAYGAETRKSKLSDDSERLTDWYERKGLCPHEYYLVVGRFVPENNYETMIAEYMKSKSNWYVFAILLMYLLTYICAQIAVKADGKDVGVTSENARKIAIGVTSGALIYFVVAQFLLPSRFSSTVMCYPLGIWIAFYEEKFLNCFLKKRWISMAVLAIILVATYKLRYIDAVMNLASICFALAIMH